LNTAVFYNQYDNIQLTLSACPTSPCALPANIGSAHVKGAEVEAEIRPTEAWEIDASASYLDFQYTEITNPSSNITLDMTTPYTPKNKWSFGTQYEIPLGGMGTLTPRIDVTHQSSVFSAAINDPKWNEIDGYTVSNARITWRHTDATWQAALNVTNLTDKLYYLTYFDLHASASYVNGQPAMPREWSISVKRNF